MMKQKNEEWKSAKLVKVYLTGRIVLVVLMALAVAYLANEYRQRLEAFLPGAQSDTKSESPRKAPWAHRLKLAGLPNLHKVSEDMYRGAQPSACESICCKLVDIKPEELPIIKTARQMGLGCWETDKIEIAGDNFSENICTDFELGKPRPLRFSFLHVCKSIGKQIILLAKSLKRR